jgi:hypothetical protein
MHTFTDDVADFFERHFTHRRDEVDDEETVGEAEVAEAVPA